MTVPIKDISCPVLVTGAGVTGRGIVGLLKQIGIPVTLADANREALAQIEAELGIITVCEEDLLTNRALFNSYGLVVTSPGWRPDAPLLRAALEAGLEVIGDVELCWRLDQDEVFGNKRRWIVVTGTNGKTTTTAMLAAMLNEAGYAAAAVGNIGVAIADALIGTHRVDILVAELSSFQLHWTTTLRPEIGVFLNLAEDHIDWHGSFNEYAAAKAKVFSAATAIASKDDDLVKELAKDHEVIFYTLGEPDAGEVGVSKQWIVDKRNKAVRIAPATNIQPHGPAGIADATAAAAAALVAGVSPEAIQRALATFSVAGHRGQVVATYRGIVAVDNSKATNPHAADSALGGFKSIVWIAGGQLKGADVSEVIRRHAQHIKAAALLGVDALKIVQALADNAPHVKIQVTQETDPVLAMNEVVEFAVSQASAGDAIVLAPAAASLDMYTGMAQRGDLFADAIKKYLCSESTRED
ncbi:UDP-N-acetylmuramoyl-L-alanine--D-glutamate ligase [Corynebacterium kutscheri]|uniref:UDP-N-acetylmuramoylalanine--D-glutamate ligase n=1 Tax=Corynebacterium kutscheri TaxID=35755 RepID=A0AB38VYH0_9CORY|nr:UDP-N-acetylmuramoyl-L-alanine--D-glutamate ligase [Corynebacterium kutscheri]VEH08841.1 UDP-N-acetylmuramoyl-L-alanyl-D-glutamate synthetase [Corynebacterium kutscheri]